MPRRLLLPAAGLLLLAAAGIWYAYRLTPDEGEMGSWPGAQTVNGIAPRWTSLEQIAARLGPPDEEAVYGADLLRAGYRAPAAGIAELTLWLDQDRYVRFVRVVPTGPLPVSEVERAIRGFSAPMDAWAGAPRRYPSGYLSVEGGTVTAIWLADGGISWRRMTREM